MDYKVIEVNKDTVITESMIGTEPIEFKFTSDGDGHQVKNILDLEVKLHDEKKQFTIRLNLKELSLATRIEVMRSALGNLDLLDSTLLLNIFNLVNSYKELSDSFFKSADVIINKPSELIDMKTKLKPELLHFSQELARYYYSVIKSVGVTDYPANNLPEIIPFLYQRVLLAADFISLSNIIRTFKSVDNLVYVENAEQFLYQLSSRYVFANALMKNAGLIK